MRRVLGVFFAVIVMLITAVAGLQAAPVKITFWHAMGGAHGKTLQTLIDRFNQAHPDIQVEGVFQGGYGPLETKLLSSIAAKNGPTLAQVYNDWTAVLVAAKALTPVANFIDSATQDDFYPGFVAANSWNGTLYTIPFNKSIYVMFYNVDRFNQLGLSVPTDMSGLRQALAKLSEQQGKPQLVLSANIDQFGVFLRNFGGRWLGADGKAAFDSPEGIAALSYVRDLIFKDKSAFITNDYNNSVFDKGDASIFIDTSSNLQYVVADHPTFNWSTAPLPHDSALAATINGTDLAIMAQASAAQQKAAWTFVRWLTDAEQLTYWATDTGYLPERRSAANSAAYQAWLAEAPQQRGAAVAELDHAAFDPGVVHWSEARGLITNAVQKVVIENADPAKTLHDAAAQVNAALGR